MIFKSIIVAFQFLTVIPIRTHHKISEKEVRNSAAFFPIVGAAQGLFLALMAFLFLKTLSTDIAAALVLVLYLFIAGGFHQDGLSDTFDALSIPSSGDREKDREKRLRVMKDSTVGPMGVIAIVLSLLLKYLLIKETLQITGPGEKYFMLVLMPLFSKWAMVIGIYHARSARNDGIGRTFIEHIGLKQLVFATIFLIFISFTVFYLWDYFLLTSLLRGINTFSLFFIFQTIVISFACLLLKYIFTKRFGGLTGDNCGAMNEIMEIIFLLVALLWR